MTERNFSADIKESIEKYFAFIKEYGFSDFKYQQISYETHFIAKNNFVTIDIFFEAISSTPIWVTINGYYIDNLEMSNSTIKQYGKELKEAYEKLFQQYLKTDDISFLNKISKQYSAKGYKINDQYLKELCAIIKRHPYILEGDLQLLIKNTEIVRNNFEKKEAAKRKKKGIYRLEYQFLSETDFDAFEEFKSLQDIRKYLNERTDINHYRILDYQLNEVALDQ